MAGTLNFSRNPALLAAALLIATVVATPSQAQALDEASQQPAAKSTQSLNGFLQGLTSSVNGAIKQINSSAAGLQNRNGVRNVAAESTSAPPVQAAPATAPALVPAPAPVYVAATSRASPPVIIPALEAFKRCDLAAMPKAPFTLKGSLKVVKVKPFGRNKGIEMIFASAPDHLDEVVREMTGYDFTRHDGEPPGNVSYQAYEGGDGPSDYLICERNR